MSTEPKTRPLHNQTAWVTGASRGIGKAIAHALAMAGARVVAGARDKEALDQNVEAIRAAGGEADAIALDVTQWTDCQAFAESAVKLAGNPSVLVNNAGIGLMKTVDQFEPEEFESQFRVNVFGMFYMTKLVVPRMRDEGRGHIVNISSLAGENEAKGGAAYFASKHAVNGFTKCLFQDVREDGIRVTLVCPGSVDTRFHLDSRPQAHERDQTWMVTPQEIAGTVVHIVTLPFEALVSKIDIRPTQKGKK